LTVCESVRPSLVDHEIFEYAPLAPLRREGFAIHPRIAPLEKHLIDSADAKPGRGSAMRRMAETRANNSLTCAGLRATTSNRELNGPSLCARTTLD